MRNELYPKHELASERDVAADGSACVRNEVIIGGSQRRRWSSDDKARIVRESMKPGAVVTEVAGRHGLHPGQLYGWRRKARAASPDDEIKRSVGTRRKGSKAAPVPTFAPVVVAAPTIAPRPSSPETSQVEIAIGDVSVRVRGAVDVGGLVAVLNAVRRSS